MKKLYIIGNGFDLHHGLKTNYWNFANYLENSNNELYTTLEKYISYPLNHDSLWADFETNLANLEMEEILSENSDYLPDYASDEFRDKDRYAFPDIMQNFFKLLTEGLFQEFQDFIQLVEYPESANSKIVEIDKNGMFYTFNYSNTLERLYGINREKVFYIHNSAFYGAGTIILGHGIDPKKFQEEIPEPPDNIDPEDYGEWYEQNLPYDYSYNTGKESLERYFETTFKQTEKVIKDNSIFFEAVKDYNEIHIYGHSLSKVDMPYFKEFFKHSNREAKWIVSFYSLSGKKANYEKMVNLGVNPKNLELIELKNIQRNNKQIELKL